MLVTVAVHIVNQERAGRLVVVIDAQVVAAPNTPPGLDVSRQLKDVALGSGQHEGAIAVLTVAAVPTAVVIELERLDALGDTDVHGARRGHVDVQSAPRRPIVGERRGDGGGAPGHGERGGIAHEARAVHMYRFSVGIGHADVGQLVALTGVGHGQRYCLAFQGLQLVALDDAARGGVYIDVIGGADERHRQVQSTSVRMAFLIIAIRKEVDRHAPARAPDCRDSNPYRRFVSFVAHLVNQQCTSSFAVVIDG